MNAPRYGQPSLANPPSSYPKNARLNCHGPACSDTGIADAVFGCTFSVTGAASAFQAGVGFQFGLNRAHDHREVVVQPTLAGVSPGAMASRILVAVHTDDGPQSLQVRLRG